MNDNDINNLNMNASPNRDDESEAEYGYDNYQDIAEEYTATKADGESGDNTADASESDSDGSVIWDRKYKGEGSFDHFKGYEDTVIVNEHAADGGSLGVGRDTNAKNVRLVIAVISVAVFLVSGYIIAMRSYDSIKAKQGDEGVSDLVISESNISDRERQLQELIAEHPELADVDFPVGFNYSYALLYAANPEFVGYIDIPGTDINGAVVQHVDDNYYLEHDFYGKYTKHGAFFAKAHNDMINLDMNTTVLGHNMKNGLRFAQLEKYKTLKGYKDSPVIEFNTAYDNYKWKIYAVYITNGYSSGDNGYLFDGSFNNVSEQCLTEYLKEVDKRKLYETGVDVLPTDKFLTLITCVYDFDEARLVIVARQVREGESEEVDVSKADWKGSDVKYPQSYYDNLGKANPFASDNRWYWY